jgi:phosphoribosyl 1,2-cyclic phosphodiesterase
MKPRFPSSNKKYAHLGVTIWGTRGSIPYPSKNTIKYGGHTTCFEVHHPGQERVFIDAGSGIFNVGQRYFAPLASAEPVSKIHILFSHLHWDHVQGLPFFPPMYQPSSEIHFYSHLRRLPKHLATQFNPPFFPVGWNHVKAKVHFHHVKPEKDLKIEGLDIRTIALHHPGGALGYRVSSNQKSLAVITDNEIAAMNVDMLVDFNFAIRQVQLLFHDAMYKSEEAKDFMGYGHSQFQDLLGLEWTRTASKKQKRQLVILHHFPNRSDAQLALIEKRLQTQTHAVRFHMGQERKTYWVK